MVKNQSRLNDPNSRYPFYLKLVAEKFKETKAHRNAPAVDAETLRQRELMQQLAESIVTDARVEKLLYKLVDEGILPEDFGPQDMPVIAKNLPRAVYNDCVKEEPETVERIENFGRYANKTAMEIVKKKL